ncbi:asparagine synthase (glutamine-hydrolyzing) [Nonomuraea indica]|uniref:asparagine synthase (glutamine-hydrolyzing) n=1 Tax=Nonomuraea indica TaxID=1581193 RepID=UPI000C7AFBEC|nr:asparagine synthase (glutamine-hydrolyzing) [Nonomuraea indica]
MCGIVGWVDFSRDLRLERDTVAAMTGTMRARGPDGEGVWTCAHAALGHRRLAVIDPAGGAQPMTALCGEPGLPVVLTYNGEIYNYRELRTELMVRGHRFRTASDTEVLLCAYLEWGSDFARHLVGIFAAALWDARREELILVRDRMGVKPLYFHPYPQGVLFASEPKGIMANPLFRPRVREEALPILLNPRLTMPGETPLDGLQQVRPGHTVVADRSGTHQTPYWRLVSRPHTDDAATTVATVRELLDDIVAHELRADVPLCTLLSGGLDSSAVTALAQRHTAPEPVRSFSVDFVGADADFRPTALRPERDTPYARLAADHLGTEHTEVVLDPRGFARVHDVTLRARDLPTLGQFDESMYLLFQAVRRRSTVALSGEAADEVFGGYPWFFDATVVWRDTFPWLGDAPRLADCLAPGLRRRLRPAQVERDRYRTLLARVPRLDGEDGLQARMREVLYLSMQGPLAYLLDRVDRMSMASGLEVRVPFCDHRLVEYVWNVPWAMKTADGREKSLLRAAVRDVLPAKVLGRAKSGYPASHDPGYGDAVRAQVRDLLRDPDSPLREALDLDRVRALAGSERDTMVFADTAHMLLPLVETDAWMRAYGVELAA